MSEASPRMRLPRVARDFVGAVLGFGVAVGLFLAPFLGAKRIPGFEPLIAVFPKEHGRLLIPVSSLLIGVIALFVQFFSEEVVARRSLTRSLTRSFVVLGLAVVIGILVLTVLYSGFVQTWDLDDGTVKTVIIGWSRSPGCGCPPGNTRSCIEGLGLIDLGTCWSDESIFGVKISLFLSYLVSIEGFAGLAGLYVIRKRQKEVELKKEAERQEKRKKAERARKRERAAQAKAKAPTTENTSGGPEAS